ncbi:muts domain V-domain-containing protein [Paraphysoderma sedebokerense]|nr:muts domain V-domain-containing protein [Paraphysoderma sedebokerense]
MEDAVSENELQEELPKIKKSKTSQNSLAKFKNQVTATPKSISNTKAFRELPSPSVSSIVTAEDRKRERTKQFNEANDKTYSWLADVRDADGKRPSEPGYDPRTLYIPESAFKKFTAFERQFWEIKCKYFDTVVFFKKGKFYELYERDADIAHREFDLRVSGRAAMRMAGVPEASFESWASRFIAKGYKIAKVDQIETAVGKSMRAKAGGKKEDKVIRRELTRVLTAGTLIDESFITNDMSTYCLSIKEQVDRDALPPTFGVVFVDTSTAEFHFTSFEDDIDRTRLETLLVQVKPKEVVYEKGGLSQRTTRLLKNTLSTPIFNALTPEKEFWDHQRTLDELDVAGYFDGSNSGDDEEMADSTSSTERFQKWPEVIREAKDDAPLMSAFGGLVWYLRTLKLDTSLLSLKNFHIYNPIQHATSLILDGQTLTNLEIFRNNSDGSTDGTLLQLLNKCTSPFGKRLFKKWMCHPLRNVDKINERLDAIEDFASVRGVKNDLEANLKQLPDLERMIGRINMGNCKLKEFLGALKAFEQSLEYIDQVKPYLSEFKSKRLIYLIENYPDIQPILDFFKDAFDHRAAAEHGEVIPKKGVEKDFDEILEVIESLELKFNEHLREVKKTLKVTNINYKDIGKDLRQLEVSSSVSVPSNFRKMSGTKTLSRYHTPTIIDLNREMAEALEIKNNILASLKKRMYKRFDSYFETWKSAVDCLAELDCLVGLANGREVLECSGPVCRPHFVSQKGENSKAVLELEELRHPCVNLGDFIPNDTALGGADHPNMILLTGPNMGGKSTLLRQTCVAIIMAQLGCFLPASKCYLTPFDRIFTRIGANDNILAGQSTFMVELSETSKILKEATNRSLVILDELGRGTSTFDGYAIAYAVLHHLLVHVGCLGLFSTHYGMLTKEFDKTPLCGNYHMACHVDEAEKQVTFLYKLTKGACPKSYGMNVANMAGVPRTIIDRAEEVAGQFEKSRKLRDLAVQMFVAFI